jgi:hypothetical protein
MEQRIGQQHKNDNHRTQAYVNADHQEKILPKQYSRKNCAAQSELLDLIAAIFYENEIALVWSSCNYEIGFKSARIARVHAEQQAKKRNQERRQNDRQRQEMWIFVTLRDNRPHHDRDEQDGEIGFEIHDANAVGIGADQIAKMKRRVRSFFCHLSIPQSSQSLRRAADGSHGEVFG